MGAEKTAHLNTLLRAYVRRYRANCGLRGLGVFALVLLLPLPSACLLDRLVVMPPWVRIGIWAAYLLAAAGTALLWLILPLVRRHTPLQAAFSLDDQCPELKETFSVAVQLDEAAKRQTHGCSRILVYSAQRQAEAHAPGLDVRKLLPRRRAWTWCGLGAMAAVAQAPLFLAASFQYPQLLARFLNPFGNYARVSGVDVAVLPGSAELGDGERLTVEARVSDPDLARLGLNLAFDGGAPQRYEMARPESGRFVFVVTNARRDFTYDLSEGLVRTASYRVRVQRRPRLERFHIRYEYPGYTGWPAKTDEKQDGHLEALAGTFVTLRVDLEDEPRRVVLRKHEGDRMRDLPMTVEGRTASIAWKLDESFAYQVVATGRLEGLTNRDPVAYTARAVPDAPPRVTLKEPSAAVKLGPRGAQEIRYLARDEFPIEALRLTLRRAGHADEHRALEMPASKTDVHQGAGTLALAELKLQPGEVVRIAVEARDVLGQWGRSPSRPIEIPVATGDPVSLREAERIAPVRAALTDLAKHLSGAHASLERLGGMLSPPPNKWTPELEDALEPLRPSFEALRQKTALLMGIAVRQREAALDHRKRRGLLPITTLATSLEQSVRRLNVEQLLIEVRQGFQEQGPARIARTAQEAGSWNESTGAAARMLAASERHLRIRDLAFRARELLEAQQRLLASGFDGSGDAARARDLQRLVLEEARALLDGIEAAAAIEPRAKEFVSQGFPELLEAADALAASPNGKHEAPIGPVAVFVSQLARMLDFLQGREREAERLSARLSQELNDVRVRQIASATLLQRLAAAAEGLLEAAQEDPLDKTDELERLPAWVAGLRRTLDALRQSAGECWARAEGPSVGPAVRRDLVALAFRLHHLDKGHGAALRELATAATATFETGSHATPLLAGMRKELGALRAELLRLEKPARICDEEERLRAWFGQLEEALRERRASLPATQPGTKNRFTFAAFESPLPALQALSAGAPEDAWRRTAQALAQGIPAVEAARAAILIPPALRRAALQRLASAWRSLAEETETQSVIARIAEGRGALSSLQSLLTVFAAEPPCLVSENAEAARKARLAFLALWEIHQEAAFPALAALDACAAESNEHAKRILSNKAREFAGEAARRLGAAAESESAWLAAAGKNPAIGPELERCSRHVAELVQAIRKAHDLPPRNAKDADPRWNELQSMLLPYATLSDAAARRELEGLAQELDIQAGELADIGRKSAQIGRSEQGLSAAYRRLAQETPAQIERLAGELNAARSPAQGFGEQVSAAVKEMSECVQRATPLARPFADTAAPHAGTAFGEALRAKVSGVEMDALLEKRVAEQQMRIGDAAVVLELLGGLRGAFEKLAEIGERYAKSEAERIAAYDRLAAQGRAAYKLLTDKAHFEMYMKYTPPPKDHPDAEKSCSQRVDEYLAQVGWAGPESYRSPMYFLAQASLHELVADGVARHWTPAFAPRKKQRPVAEFWDAVADSAKHIAGLADGFLREAESKAPEDLPALRAFKTDFLKAHDLLKKAVSDEGGRLVSKSWKETRRAFAEELANLATSVQPAVDLLAARAMQTGWSKPVFDVSGKGRAPRLPKPQATLESAAWFALALAAELKSVHMYDLLGGENDPNCDLQRALTIQLQVPPANVLEQAARLAEGLRSATDQLEKGLGNRAALERDLKNLETEKAALSGLAHRIHDLALRERSLRAALLSAGEGKMALDGRFVQALESLPRAVAALRARLERLMQTAPALNKGSTALQDASQLLAREAWAAPLAEMQKALKGDERDRVAAKAAAQADLLDRAAQHARSALRRIEVQPSAQAAPGLASLAARALAAEAWGEWTEWANAEASPDAAICAGLLLAQRLGQAAALEIDAACQDFVSSAGSKQWLALQALIKSVASAVETAGVTREGPQVLGRLQLRPAGNDPGGLHYGQLPPALQRDLMSASREERPPEMESAWKRYVQGILNPPPPNVPLAKGGAR